MTGNTIREIKLWKVNTDTNERKLIACAYANNALSIRLLRGKEETLSFHLDENEKLEKEYVYR